MGRADDDAGDAAGSPQPSRPGGPARGKASAPRPGANRPAPRPRKGKKKRR
jgi:hypothetical protein